MRRFSYRPIHARYARHAAAVACFVALGCIGGLCCIGGLAGCSAGDSHESLKDQYLARMREMKTILDRVVDRASAEHEKPALERLVASINDLGKRAEALGEPPPAIREEIQQESESLRGSFMKLAFNQEIRQVLQPVFENLGQGLGPKQNKRDLPSPTGGTGAGGVGQLPVNDPEALARWVEQAQRATERAAERARAEDGVAESLLTDPSASVPGSTPAPPAAADAGLEANLKTLLSATATLEEKHGVLRQLNLRPAAQLPAAVVTALVQALDDKDFTVRSQVVALISRFGARAEPAVSKLASLLDDGQIGAVAASALASLGEHAESALPVLTEQLGKVTSPATVAGILSVLEALGPAARSALPSLDGAAKRFPYLGPRIQEVRHSIEGG